MLLKEWKGAGVSRWEGRTSAGLPVFVSEDPLSAVVNGAGIMLQDDNLWE